MRPEIPRFPGFIHPNVGLEAVGGFCQPSRRTPRANVWSRLERRRPDAAASMYATVAANSAWLSTTITWASEWPRASGQGTQPRVEICFFGGRFFYNTTVLRSRNKDTCNGPVCIGTAGDKTFTVHQYTPPCFNLWTFMNSSTQLTGV